MINHMYGRFGISAIIISQVHDYNFYDKGVVKLDSVQGRQNGVAAWRKASRRSWARGRVRAGAALLAFARWLARDRTIAHMQCAAPYFCLF